MSDDNDGVINIKRPAKPRGKPFVKGQSGNPAGKPKGIESTPDRLRRMIRERIPEVIEVLVQSALAGDAQAARLLRKGLCRRLRLVTPR